MLVNTPHNFKVLKLNML